MSPVFGIMGGHPGLLRVDVRFLVLMDAVFAQAVEVILNGKRRIPVLRLINIIVFMVFVIGVLVVLGAPPWGCFLGGLVSFLGAGNLFALVTVYEFMKGEKKDAQ